MSDWQVGDLAVCVTLIHPRWEHPSSLLETSRVYTVEVVGRPQESCGGEFALGLVEVKPWRPNCGFPCSMFCKVTPDKHKACEDEFVTLLKRSKRKVGA